MRRVMIQDGCLPSCREYKMKKYETPENVMDAMMKMISEQRVKIIQSRSIGRDVIKLFEAIEGLIHKLKDQFEFRK